MTNYSPSDGLLIEVAIEYAQQWSVLPLAWITEDRRLRLLIWSSMPEPR